jgi:hypothetical protein
MEVKTMTTKVLDTMLKENTGTHLLDSGSAYGRNWERNQQRSFKSEPACQVEAKNWNNEPTLSISYNVYHYLNNFLEYDARMQTKFDSFVKRIDPDDDKCWLELMELFADEFTNYGTTNTYNYDNLLSQVLQYTMFSATDDEYDCYVLLQIHGGCDVRGGYTAPKVFKVIDRDYFILAQADCRAVADNGMSWYSDDCGYHWYSDYDEPQLSEVLKVIKGAAFIEVQEPIKENIATMLFDKTKYGRPPTEPHLYKLTFGVTEYC